MAFDAKPQSWLGAGYKLESSIAMSITTQTASKLWISTQAYGPLFPFMKNDDPVYFTTSFGTIVANTVYYLRNITNNVGEFECNIADVPSWAGTQTNQTWPFPSVRTLALPARINFHIQNTGIDGLPKGLDTLSAAQANATTGDIRYFFLELPKMLKRLWDAKAAADRPKRVRIDSHDFIAAPTMATRNYLVELDLSYSTTAVAAEPPV